MNEQAVDEQARIYADAYVNGNRTDTCLAILERHPGPASYARGCAAVMAAKVAVIIMREDQDMVEEFIRLLESQIK